MIQRRGFLSAILAAGVAPAFVGSSILMPVKAIALPPTLETAFQSILSSRGTFLPGDTFTLAGVLDKSGRPKRFQVLTVHSGGASAFIEIA